MIIENDSIDPIRNFATSISGTASTTPLTPLNFASETVIPYSKNLFYEPIPYDFMHFSETASSFAATVDGIETICATPNLDCTYSYIIPTGLITSFSHSGLTLTINGRNLPSSISQITYGSI